MPADANLIQQLLEEILESGRSPQEVCRDHPELIDEVVDRLARARALETQIDAVFPVDEPRAEQRTARRLATKLPQIPGYQVDSVIGVGGSGVVYRARHLKLNRLVAIKMLLAGGYAGPHELERFKREAEAIAGICHPNIVQVFDAGECDGHPYFVMEFMDGGSLAAHLDGRPRTASVAAAQVATLARAVHAAHTGGIMHRDLKPANILLAIDGTLKIADFGLARRSGQPDPAATLTRAGARMGTPSYMSPEQASGIAVGFCPLIDIYALGAILYEMLTGRPPFRAETAIETERQVIANEPVAPSRLNPRVPRDLQTICLKCLQKDPKRRYNNAADLADDLNRFMRGEPIRARPVSAIERATKWCRRHPAGATGILLVAALTASVIAAGFWLHHIQDARRTERIVRRQAAQAAIESSLPLLDWLGRGRNWTDAAGILGGAKARLADAESPELSARVKAAESNMQIAQELDRIRQTFAEPADTGYSFFPAQDAYADVFARIGLGRAVPIANAAATVNASPLRDLLLAAIDHAAFTELFTQDDTERLRLLDIAKAAAPDPWQDRFRDGQKWRDVASLRALARDARSASPAPPLHQLVILGLLLADLGANDITVELLRDAQLRDPSDFWVNLELGSALTRAGLRTQALQFYRTAVSLRPNHYVAWTTLGATLIGDAPEEALAPLRKAIQINPAFASSWKLLISALADLERWDDAQIASRQAQAASPSDQELARTDGWLLLRRARAAANARDWTSAAILFPKAIHERYADDSEVWFEQAAIDLLAGDVARYQAACTTLLEASEHAAMRPFLAMRACTLGAAPESLRRRAAQLAKAELEQSATAAWALTVRGAMLCRDHLPQEAVPVFEASIRADPSPEAAVLNWLWLAHAHLALGQPEVARQWLNTASQWLDQQQRKPRSIHLHNWLEAHILRRDLDAMLTTR